MYLPFSIHARPNEYFVTHGFNWLDENWTDDVRHEIKNDASLKFVVTCPFEIRLSHQVRIFPMHLDMEHEIDPLLSVVRTFEFERPRTGDLDSLVNLGLINFKYSQRATPPEQPKSVFGFSKPKQEWLEYVDNECEKMNKDMKISNIKQINLVEGGYFEFVCEGENGTDTIVKDERQYTPVGPFKYDGSWPFWNSHYKTEKAPEFQNILKLKLTKVYGRGRHADEYRVCEE
jgi:hypothetical protein